MSQEMLNKHFILLYTVLEPRDIANEMFQAGQISPHDHDDITNNRKKYKRLKILLDVLEIKQLYASFACLLESLQYTSLLETLNTDSPYINIQSEDAVCIQHNFTTLQDELHGADYATTMMENVLSESNVSDIESCSGAYRQKSKMLKILILNGQDACKQLFEAIRSSMKREDLIQKMKNHSKDISKRGRPVLESNLHCLTTACLLKHEDFLYEELEPRDICDFLFEEGAVDILSHDRITETSQRRKQVKYLIKTIMENKHDCFHFFLYILQRKHYGYIRQTLAEYTSDGVRNEPIHLRLAVQYDNGTEMCQTLYQNIHSFDTLALRELISRGHITMERATSISVEVQIRHISDEPDPERLDDKEYKRVLRNVYKMLEKAETFMAKVKDSANPLQINIQVQSFYSERPKSSDNIRKRISSNFKNILDEMQLPLARETLSRCTGDVEEIWKKMLPTNGSRRQRMFEFIQFILQRRENRIEFERILKKNGLKKVMDTWTEEFNSGKLRALLESYKVEIPNYPETSFAKILLEGPLLTDFVQEVRSLARRVVLSKNFEEKEKKPPGTVMVFEVTVTNEDNEVVIDEKDPEDFVDFFEKTQKDLFKVIMIEGIWGSVSETKKRVYQNYQQYIESGTIYLHHESEQYAEVSKLSALQKIKSYKHKVELLRASIPLDNIHDIIENAVDRALTADRIKKLCFDASIDGIGSTYSGAYNVRFFLTLHRIKSELKKQTIESIKECLGSEILFEIRRHLNMGLENTRLPLRFILDLVNMVAKVMIGSLLIVITSILNPFAGVVAVVATGLWTFFSAEDVNSRSWREGVAMEIFTDVSNKRYNIKQELSSHLWQNLNVTSDHLKTVAENLEDYRRSIYYINPNDTCS